MWLGGAHAWASPFMPPQPGHGRRVQYESLGAACVRGHQSSCIEGTGERGPIQGLARRAVAAGLSPTAALSPRRVQVTVRPGPAVHGGGSVLTSALTAAGALPGCTSMRPGPLLTETPEVAACASCPRSHKGRQSRDPDSSPLCGGLGRRSCPPHTGESPFLGAISHFPLRCAPPHPHFLLSLISGAHATLKGKNHRADTDFCPARSVGRCQASRRPRTPGRSGSQRGEIRPALTRREGASSTLPDLSPWNTRLCGLLLPRCLTKPPTGGYQLWKPEAKIQV